MKTYIQPQIGCQSFEANSLICASVTDIKSSIVTLKGDYVNTGDAR